MLAFLYKWLFDEHHKRGFHDAVERFIALLIIASVFAVLIENTPIDYLDFASPDSGLGSKMGMDATNKMPGETDREWGVPIVMDEDVKKRVDDIWDELGIM